ncbi:hypothetical protein [Streptomyces fulvoviolaceus]|uniref:hypothetical protein n=1 Tax=Streptomyces fulvoviolaceus TaxID=285535 RepID=UPI0021BE51BD|nr:hypothetical protein [Streptomyces fulvoviolaceus]MCT9075447.1 hypothetical protein [Streptomyces fulvoviolaceus]
MAYASTTLHLLISAPGDVTEGDRAVIQRSISRWNFNYGKQFQLTILPIWWGEHASAEFGEHPQDVINRQLIDDADLALAIFWTRLGTGTKRAVSGTAEEIERMAKAGKTVSVLHCTRPIPSNSDLDQQISLRDYLKGVQSNALLMTYSDDVDLASRVDNLLSRQATLFMAKVYDSKTRIPEQDLGVWPSLDFRERVATDSKGRVRTRRSHYLVLTNKGSFPAKSVTFSFDPNDDIILIDDDQPIDILAPESEIRFPLSLTMGGPRQFNCVVKWVDPSGEEKENAATLRPA